MNFSDTTVVIPAKDEEAVFEVVDSVLDALEGCKVIVLYNGYGGKALHFKSPRVKAYPAPVGKGRAVAMMHHKRLVKTPIVCFIDGDATYEPRNLRRMVAMVRDGYDMVLGNRLDNVSLESMPRWIQFGNRVITSTTNLLYGMGIGDSQTGLRAMLTDVFHSNDIEEEQFGMETEMNIKVKRRGLRIGEVHADYYPRKGETKQVKLGGVNHLLIAMRYVFHKPKGQKKPHH